MPKRKETMTLRRALGSVIMPAIHHERCTCKHCRCQHVSGFEGCAICSKCLRYTWPGPGADLPSNHKRATAPHPALHISRYSTDGRQ